MLSPLQCIFVLSIGLILSGSCVAAVETDSAARAKQLYTVAINMLDQESLTPRKYAEALFTMEQARDMLERVGQEDSELGQALNTDLIWARRGVNTAEIHELDALRQHHQATVAFAPKQIDALSGTGIVLIGVEVCVVVLFLVQLSRLNGTRYPQFTRDVTT